MATPRPERLFLALWPDPPVRRALDELARTRLPPGLGRPVPAANLHLTLLFLGAVEAAARSSLEAACASIAMRPVSLELDHLGCWPRARVAWTAPTRTPVANDSPNGNMYVREARLIATW